MMFFKAGIYLFVHIPWILNFFKFFFLISCLMVLMHGMFQQMLARKDQSLTKYQEMLKEARDDARKQADQHKSEIKLLQDRLHLESDEVFRKMKLSHQVSKVHSCLNRCMSVCLSLCSSICPSVCYCLSVCLYVYFCSSVCFCLSVRLLLPVCLCLNVCLSLCSSVCPSVCYCLSVCLYVYFCSSVCFCLSVRLLLSVCLCLYVCLSLSLCLSVFMFVRLSLRLSVCLSVLSTNLFVLHIQESVNSPGRLIATEHQVSTNNCKIIDLYHALAM
jgi:hypothetical protein